MSLTKYWIQINSFLAFLFGLVLFLAPEWALSWIMHSSDGVHWHLGRCVGAQFIGYGLMWMPPTWPTHPELNVSVSSSRIVFGILTAIIGLNFIAEKHNSGENLVQSFVPYLIAFCIFQVVTSIIHLLRNKCVAGRQFYTDKWLVNMLVQLDGLASLIIGSAWMAYPYWLLHRQVSVTLNATHLLWGRFLGSNMVATALPSGQCLYWLDATDRKRWCYGRVLAILLIFLAQIWSQIFYQQWWSGRHWIGISLFGIWTVIAAWFGVNVKKAKFG